MRHFTDLKGVILTRNLYFYLLYFIIFLIYDTYKWIYPIKYFLWSPSNSYKINFFWIKSATHRFTPKTQCFNTQNDKKWLACQISLQIRHVSHSLEVMAIRESCPSRGRTLPREARAAKPLNIFHSDPNHLSNLFFYFHSPSIIQPSPFVVQMLIYNIICLLSKNIICLWLSKTLPIFL